LILESPKRPQTDRGASSGEQSAWKNEMDNGSLPEISFRAATAEDIDALRHFEQRIVNAERAFDPTLIPGPFQYHDIEKMLLMDHARFIVVQRGNQLVGCGFAAHR
jgi:hypothetical protein